MSNWNNWRVIITATQAEDFVLRTDSQGPPVLGPNGEAIDTAKSRIIDHRGDDLVAVKQMNNETGVLRQLTHIKLTANANQTITYEKTFDADINIISSMCVCTADLAGDTISVLIEPNTTIGTLTAPASTGNTVLTVSQTVIDNCQPLYRVRLASVLNPSGVFEDVGIITNFDEINMTITVKTPLVGNWPAGTTLVQITPVYVDNVEFAPIDWVQETGKDKIGVSFLAKGRKIVFIYKNNNMLVAHTLNIYISFFYGRVIPT